MSRFSKVKMPVKMYKLLASAQHVGLTRDEVSSLEEYILLLLRKIEALNRQHKATLDRVAE